MGPVMLIEKSRVGVMKYLFQLMNNLSSIMDL